MDKMTQKSLKACDHSLELVLALETAFTMKIDFLQQASQKQPHDNFSSLTNQMKEEQQKELEILQKIIKLVTFVKQDLCNHPKKDRDICHGVIYCMNCNCSLKSK